MVTLPTDGGGTAGRGETQKGKEGERRERRKGEGREEKSKRV